VFRKAEAFVLAAYGGPELWNKTQEAFFNAVASADSEDSNQKQFRQVVRCIVKDDLETLVDTADLAQWQFTVAILCTYAKSDNFSFLVAKLGARLEGGEGEPASSTKASEQSSDNLRAAMQCYLIAGHLNSTVRTWLKLEQLVHNNNNGKAVQKSQQSTRELQQLIEKVSVFRRAINHHQPLPKQIQDKFGYVCMYACLHGWFVRCNQK
jgi:protein transport protein SEC31